MYNYAPYNVLANNNAQSPYVSSVRSAYSQNPYTANSFAPFAQFSNANPYSSMAFTPTSFGASSFSYNPSYAQAPANNSISPLLMVLIARLLQAKPSAETPVSEQSASGVNPFFFLMMSMLGKASESTNTSKSLLDRTQSAQIAALQVQNLTQADNIEDLQVDNAVQTVQITQLETKNAEQSKQLNDLKTQNTAQQDKINQLEQTIKNVDTSVAEQAKKLAEQQAEVARLKTTQVEDVQGTERVNITTTRSRPNIDVTAIDRAKVNVNTGSLKGDVKASVSGNASTTIRNLSGSTVNATVSNNGNLVVNAAASTKETSVDVTTNNAAKASVVTGSANDTVKVKNNGGTVSVNTGRGNDSITVDGLAKGSNTNINAGAGTNIITLTGSAADYTVKPKNRNRNSSLVITDNRTGGQATVSGVTAANVKFTA